MKKSLKVLDAVVVKNPCQESWEQMKGGEKSRFCLKCSHSVVNLSAMTRSEAEKLIARKNDGRLCVRYFVNDDGTTRYKTPVNRPQQVWRVATVLVVALLSLFGFTGQGMTDDGASATNQNTERANEVMGKMLVQKNDTTSPTPSPEKTIPPGSREIMGDIAVLEEKERPLNTIPEQK
jgi:hypothetical protein